MDTRDLIHEFVDRIPGTLLSTEGTISYYQEAAEKLAREVEHLRAAIAEIKTVESHLQDYNNPWKRVSKICDRAHRDRG